MLRSCSQLRKRENGYENDCGGYVYHVNGRVLRVGVYAAHARDRGDDGVTFAPAR
jgi:hypothetical protein